jgi:hypothetical protein
MTHADDNSPDSTPSQGLYAQDAQALDALIEAGWDLSRVPEALRQRAHRAVVFLGVLDMHPGEGLEIDVSLVDATVSRVAVQGRGETVTGPNLLRDDIEAIDHLVQSGWNVRDVPARVMKRAMRLERLLETLQPSGRSIGSSDLVERTLHNVMRERRVFDAMPLDLRGVKAPGFRLGDLGAIAAMLLVGLAVLAPTMGAAREQAMRSACAAGLGNAGVGFSLYANDNQGRLPTVEGSIPVSLPGASTWWNVGSSARSHSANLFVLLKSGYVDQPDLACDANPSAPVHLDLASHDDWRSSDEVSYSYQLFTNRNERLGDRRMVLLVDRSPVVVRAMRHEQSSPSDRSLNHSGAGQNVLFADRSVTWLSDPVTPWGDNIWLPASMEGDRSVTLKGVETPEDEKDAFVGP